MPLDALGGEPTVGEPVIYYAPAFEPYEALDHLGNVFTKKPAEHPFAAVITAVHADGEVALHIFQPAQPGDVLLCRADLGFDVDQHRVPFSAAPKPGHWTWPP